VLKVEKQPKDLDLEKPPLKNSRAYVSTEEKKYALLNACAVRSI